MSTRCDHCHRRLWLPFTRLCGRCRVEVLLAVDTPCVDPAFENPKEAHTAMVERMLDNVHEVLVETPYVYRCTEGHHHYSYRTAETPFDERLSRLVRRGVDPAITDQLWATLNTAMATKLEKATDLEVKALNDEWLARALPPDPFDIPPESVTVNMPLTLTVYDHPAGLSRLELHPVKEVSVVPKVGQQVTVTFRVTQVEWRKVYP